MVVVAIIAILATLLSPLLFTAREKARRSACLSNLKNIGSTIRQYAGGNGGQIPPSAIDFTGHNLLPLEAIPTGGVSSSKVNSTIFHLSYIALHNVNLLRGNPRVFKCPSRSSHDVNEDVYNANLSAANMAEYGNNQEKIELSYPYFVNDFGSLLTATVSQRLLLGETNYGGETSIARDRIINHGYDFGNVLYGDGHVEEKSILGGALVGVSTGGGASENSWVTFHNKTGLSGHSNVVITYNNADNPFENKTEGLQALGTISWFNNLESTLTMDTP